ncbi:Ca-activated chloride channel family protein [Microbacterium phyllosphaerae]|uniref:Ca-activated chloride channel family protein n=1 Tax=Microbacterium phyllosphaerae TaxID=124798 RepID=A0ABS4WMB3_9MICO|nr:VWA domain-containing protein [Microbacterium phyllosphaerae]MBP2377171.1 Ca-activated chloride channel family protein [Microbacterium phyllosphaerae]
MIFQPVLNVFLLVLLCAPVAALAVLALTRAKGRDRALWVMRLVMLLACFVMFLRPGIPGGATETLATDTDIVLVVDTTASIVAEDWDGDQPRLDGVRADVQAIVDEYPGARFALITFDASADLRMPLTTDTTSLVSSLDVLRPEVTSQSRGSSIGLANQLLADTLSNAATASPDRSRMVFYFGDGEQTVTTDPESFDGSATFTDAGAVLGYGTAEGGPMQLTTGSVDGSGSGEYIEYQGSNALSVIDEGNLEAIAEQLGVDYQHRTADAELTLPDAPSTTTSYSESGSVGNVTELYWIAALVVVALLGVELARASMLVARLRLLRARPARAARGDRGRRENRPADIGSPAERGETRGTDHQGGAA